MKFADSDPDGPGGHFGVRMDILEDDFNVWLENEGTGVKDGGERGGKDSDSEMYSAWDAAEELAKLEKNATASTAQAG